MFHPFLQPFEAAPPPRSTVEWENLGFGLTTKDTNMVVQSSAGQSEINKRIKRSD